MMQFFRSSSSQSGAKQLVNWLFCLLVITLLIDFSAARSPVPSSSDISSLIRHCTSESSSSLDDNGSNFWNDELMPQNNNDDDDDQLTPYHNRKEEWERRYTCHHSLREIFGRNRNRLWGDLDPGSARRLYKSLMPRVLMELVKSGVQPEDLAPLAYKARVAAKLYARERSTVPARVAATVYDGVRQFKRYGRFQANGMTYEQIWDKYEQVVMNDHQQYQDYKALTEKDLVSKICLKIVEKSCSTNEGVDRRVLPSADVPPTGFLQRVTETLEKDVRKLLDTLAENRTTRKAFMVL